MKERMFLIVSEGNHMTYGKVINGKYLELQPCGRYCEQSGQPINKYLPLMEGDFRMSFESVVDTEYNYLIIELLEGNKSEIIKTWNEEDCSVYLCDDFKHLRN